MEEIEKTWLAGLVDGEGTITILRHRVKGRNKALFRPLLCITNSNLEILQRCKAITGVGEIYQQKRQELHYRQVHRWMVSDGKAVSIILEIRPYLIAKRRQAEIVCNLSSFKGIRGDEAYMIRASLWEEVKSVNKSPMNYQKSEYKSEKMGCAYEQ